MAKFWLHVIGVLLFVPGIACSQTYPTKPVRIVIPLGPGNSVEIATRLVTQQLTPAFGQQFVIETQPGASSQIGIERVAKAPPDGYTLLATNDNIVSLPSLQKNVSFNVIRDFSPITQIAGFPLVLIVHPSVPARTTRELILLAKETPGKTDFTSGGVGSIQHIAMELFMRTTDIKMNHIPYKGAPQAMMDVLAGQMPVAFSPSPIVAGYIRADRLRALAIGSDRRLPLLPDVPTLGTKNSAAPCCLGRAVRAGGHAGGDHRAPQPGGCQSAKIRGCSQIGRRLRLRDLRRHAGKIHRVDQIRFSARVSGDRASRHQTTVTGGVGPSEVQ
jgi:tripartite-type tricarboxylate transporter receptor subunit TctC